MNEMTINYNGQDYIANYNSQTGYYEVSLEAPLTGGIYDAKINFTDLFGQSYEDTQIIQVWKKGKIKIETSKVFMWIFSWRDFSVKDIVEIADYEINIDEETNANSIINILKKTTAKAKDIVAIKKNNEVVYWGIVENIQNEDGKQLYQYTLKYITNLFDQTIELKTTNRIKNNDNIEDGLYVIRYSEDTDKVADVDGLSLENNAPVFVGEYNGGTNQLFGISKQLNGYYKIMVAHSHKYLTVKDDGSEDVVQYEEIDDDRQLWKIEKVGEQLFSFCSKYNNKYIRVRSTQYLRADTTEQSTSVQFKLDIQKDEDLMRNIGVEDLIKREIIYNFIENPTDEFINQKYLKVIAKTHTPKQTSISNVQDRIFNLHTWMTNCTQNYNIVYEFNVVDNMLLITIEAKESEKELIDVQAQAISNYSEVFETNVVSKVVVLNSGDTYNLYLLDDRTTTTDASNPNRALGRTETVYTEKNEDAPQKALDIIKANSYNHNITFNMFGKFIKVGTPIAIKTKESLILDTYISAIKITQNKFYEYTCGNIRVKFIDKLLKERKK